MQSQLYIVAELFTGSEERDCEIINRMGINSCIRGKFVCVKCVKYALSIANLCYDVVPPNQKFTMPDVKYQIYNYVIAD